MVAVGRALAARRDVLVAEWARWIHDRIASAPTVRRPTVERHLSLLVEVLIEMSGPLRRRAFELWLNACEAYGKTLIRDLSEVIAALPARASLATVLRLNRMVDKGIAHAVVGYTDSLVETLFNRRGVPVGVSGPLEDEIEARLKGLETELESLRQSA